MTHSQHPLMLATALAAGLAVLTAPAGGPARADENTPAAIDPGFVPDTGQINRGFDPPVPSAAPASRPIPTPEQARAALMSPDPLQTAAGQSPATTTGLAASGDTQQQGPIGATVQTMPAKFSERNDILDRVPIMAWPLLLSDQQRQQIYQAVMADQAQPVADADKLALSSALSTDQALNGMHPLPESVRGIVNAMGLKYVKAKDKVWLVDPATRTVVDQITAS
jgi:hypothetical protein